MTTGLFPSSSSSAPRSLRVVHLRDRLVLHDTTYTLRNSDPSGRNAVIDAANAANTRHSHHQQGPAISLTPPPGHIRSASQRYLVFLKKNVTEGHEKERKTSKAFLATSPEEAGLGANGNDVLAVEGACGVLGCLELAGGMYVILASSIRKAGELPEGGIYAVVKVRMVRIYGNGGKTDEKLSGPILKVLESGYLYYSLDWDLTRGRAKGRFQKDKSVIRGGGGGFWWTWPMVEGWGEALEGWALRTVYGFVGSVAMSVQGSTIFRKVRGRIVAKQRLSSPGLEGRRGSAMLIDIDTGDGRIGGTMSGNAPVVESEFMFTLVSRRSRRRAGTRYITRGVDAMGDVANFVETEQIVWRNGSEGVCSFLVNRGSIPVFWRQNNGIARPSPELDAPLRYSQVAFGKHFAHMCQSYGNVVAVSLVDKKGSEGTLAEAFEKHMDLEKAAGHLDRARLVSFDFHAMCAGKEYERGLAALLSQLGDDLDRFGIHATGLGLALDTRQTGIFRVNCVDCLDRTNVVQSLLARKALDLQIRALFYDNSVKQSSVCLYGLSEDRFKHIWGDNADAISKQYSGTGALKTDFTRTGKRSTSGVIGDGVKSVMRMYYKNFIDEGRQEAIDLMCGYATARAVSTSSLSTLRADTSTAPAESTRPSQSFVAMRMNAGGDRQQVAIDLSESSMLLYSQEGVQFAYPRSGLTAWEKYDSAEIKSSRQSARIRMLYEPESRFPGTANPLDLVFREGSRAREQFWRSYLTWTSPRALDVTDKSFRVRILSASITGKQSMADWGLDTSRDDRLEIVVLTAPETGASRRPWGLAAVPEDVERSGFDLVAARSIDEGGPAIAVLVSKSLSRGIVAVNEAVFPSDRGTKVKSLDGKLPYTPSSHSSNKSFGPKSKTSSFGGEAVGVSLSVLDMTLCFVSVNLSSAEDLQTVLTTMKLGKYPYDLLSQYHHAYVVGRFGPLVKDGAGIARSTYRKGDKWTRLSDGLETYSLSNNVSVLRSSFPALGLKDLLSHEPASSLPPFTHPLSSSLEPICLCEDELLPPTSSSSATNSLAVAPASRSLMKTELDSCLVVFSELEVRDLQAPSGVDRSMGLTSYLYLTCRNVLSGERTTKTTAHPNALPEWKEHLAFSTIGRTTREDVTSEFALIAVMLVTPLGDDIPAGFGIVSLKTEGNFNTVIRYGENVVGNVKGRLQLRWGEGIDDVSDTKSSYKQANGRRAIMRESLRESGRKSAISDGFSAMKDGLNISANKKKGAKQLKAMVGKVSSLFGNSGRGSGRGMQPYHPGELNKVNPVRDSSMQDSFLSPGRALNGSRMPDTRLVEMGSRERKENKAGFGAKGNPLNKQEIDNEAFTDFQGAGDSPRSIPREDSLMKGLKAQKRVLDGKLKKDPLLIGLAAESSLLAPESMENKMRNLSMGANGNTNRDRKDSNKEKKATSSGLLIDL